MKTSLLFLLLSLLAWLPACTVASGNGWKYSSVGGDAEGISAAGIARVNNSTAFGKGADTVKGMFTNYLLAEGIKYLGGKYYDAKGAEVSSAETVKLEELRNAKSAADAEAALKAAEQAAAAEEAAAAAAAIVPAPLVP